MTDLERILPLWRELETAEVDYVLATVVAVEGPSYRKPGARMLLAPDGRRAGTVSGGCLEAEVAKRAWWLTAQGPVVERYSRRRMRVTVRMAPAAEVWSICCWSGD